MGWGLVVRGSQGLLKGVTVVEAGDGEGHHPVAVDGIGLLGQWAIGPPDDLHGVQITAAERRVEGEQHVGEGARVPVG